MVQKMSEVESQEIQIETLESGLEEVIGLPEKRGEWFILQCYTGQEKKVQTRIFSVVEEKSLGDKVFQVLVPEEEIVEIKNNKRLEKVSKIFPGYVFIEMVMDDAIYHEIRSLMGVAKFIGSKSRPTPVTEEDILRVLRKMGDKSKTVDVDFEEGEVVKVIGGPFRGYSGPISEINAEKGILKALISIFGRETPVQLDFDQVERAV